MIDPVFSLLFLAAVIISGWALFRTIRRRRDSESKLARLVPIVCAMGAIGLFLYYAGPPLLVSNEGMATIYVLTPQSKAIQFTHDLALIAQRHGLTTNLGKSTDSKGDVVAYILQASGHWMWLWSTNMLMDSGLDPAVCGHHPEFNTDPGQYIVEVSPVLPFGTKKNAQTLVAAIGGDLEASGYKVRSTPVMCSDVAKSMSEP